MTLEEFIKEFLPNFDERWECASSELKQISSIELIKMGFNVIHFEEALQNFTYKICEAQKEICASGSSVYLNINSRPYPNELIAIIIKSVHPNIEDL
mgnify:FL=1